MSLLLVRYCSFGIVLTLPRFTFVHVYTPLYCIYIILCTVPGGNVQYVLYQITVRAPGDEGWSSQRNLGASRAGDTTHNGHGFLSFSLSLSTGLPNDDGDPMLQQRHLRRDHFTLYDDPLHKCLCDTKGAFSAVRALSFNTIPTTLDEMAS